MSVYVSNCCGASIVENTDICSDCREHCKVVESIEYLADVLDLADKEIKNNTKESK